MSNFFFAGAQYTSDKLTELEKRLPTSHAKELKNAKALVRKLDKLHQQLSTVESECSRVTKQLEEVVVNTYPTKLLKELNLNLDVPYVAIPTFPGKSLNVVIKSLVMSYGTSRVRFRVHVLSKSWRVVLGSQELFEGAYTFELPKQKSYKESK